MTRLFLFAPLAAMLVLAGCGGGGDSPEPTHEDGPPTATPTVADLPLQTPTPVGPDEVVLTVVHGDERFEPKLSEFDGLPMTEIEAGGKTYTGVSLQALAERVNATPESFVTVQGTRGDAKRMGIIRFKVAEIGADSVLFVNESGHLFLASKSVPADQWISIVSGVAFHQ